MKEVISDLRKEHHSVPGKLENTTSTWFVPLWILIVYFFTLSIKLYSILSLTVFATEVNYPLINIYLFSTFEDLGLLAIILLVWLVFFRSRFIRSLFSASLLFLFFADTLLILALFRRLTVIELYRYADELPAVLTFLAWWHLPLILLLTLVIWLTRNSGIRIRRGKPILIILLVLISTLPWILSAANVWDPYVDLKFCNVLRVNSRVQWITGLPYSKYQATARQFPDLAKQISLKPGERISQLVESSTTISKSRQPRPNVILLISESLSRIDSLRSGGYYDRLPQIDSIAAKGVTFTNLVSNGSNTSEALVSLLTGEEPFPTGMIEDSLVNRFPSTNCESEFENLVCLAKRNGYSTFFISNAPLNFQKNRQWLKTIGFDFIQGGESEFFQAQPKGTFGSAPDRFLYSQAISRIQRQNQPFFLVLMTISLHRPYLVPDEAEKPHENDFYNLLHYVDQTTFNFWKSLDRINFFSNGPFYLVGAHRRMTPLEPMEMKNNGIDSLGRVFGCLVGDGIPEGIKDKTPINLNDLMNLIWTDLSGIQIDYMELDRINKGLILGMGFPFTSHLLNLDLAEILVRIPGREPQFLVLNRWLDPDGFVDDPEMQQVVAYIILNSGKLDRRQKGENEFSK